MKIVVVGHSLCHPRQSKLFENTGHEVMMISPNKWGDDIPAPSVLGLEPKFNSDGRNFANFYLEGFEKEIKEFNPDIVYAMQEPFTFLAWQTYKISKYLNKKFAIFTWENVKDRRFPGILNEFEEKILHNSDLVICGNQGAVERVRSISPEAKTTILPQTGIDTELFKPDPSIKKFYNVGYIGRFVPEKTLIYSYFLKFNPNLRSISVGGKGDAQPQGEFRNWCKFEDLFKYYNQINCLMTLPFSGLNDYHEQFNYTIGEALSCETPVIASDNGSIPEVYKGAPNLYIVPQGEQGLPKIEKCLMEMKFLTNEKQKELSTAGRNWVIENLSNQVISEKYIKTFEDIING